MTSDNVPSSEERENAPPKQPVSKAKPVEGKSAAENIPLKKKENRHVTTLKKIGFSVWVTVMAIGGVLAFLTSLLLL